MPRPNWKLKAEHLERENVAIRAVNAELLAACKLVAAEATNDEHRGDDLLWTTAWQVAVAAARAAIAKATGGE